jgi:tetratricopeptide (TPR) repeat protein
VEEAIDAHTRALDLRQTAGDHHGEASAWNNLGSALGQAGRVEEAIDAHTRALDLRQTAGDHHGEASAWNNLGSALEQAGRVEEAIEAYGKALGIYQEFEDWYRAGQILHNLARAHEDAGRPADARAYWLQSADVYTCANAPTEAAQARTWAAELPEQRTPASQGKREDHPPRRLQEALRALIRAVKS